MRCSVRDCQPENWDNECLGSIELKGIQSRMMIHSTDLKHDRHLLQSERKLFSVLCIFNSKNISDRNNNQKQNATWSWQCKVSVCTDLLSACCLFTTEEERNVWILKVEISDFNWLNIQRAALSYTLLQMPIHSRHADLVEQCWYDYKQAQDCQQRTPEKLQMMSRTLKEILMVANSQLCCQGSLSSGIPG